MNQPSKLKQSVLAFALLGPLLAAVPAAQASVSTFGTTFGPEGGSGRTGTGSAMVTFDGVTHVLAFSGNFSGLSGNTTQAHFHCCTSTPFTGTAGIAVDSPTLPGFPLGVKNGSFSSSLDLDDSNNFNATYFTASGGTTDLAIARFIAGIDSRFVYLNIHTTTFPGGEIRGFLTPVPEPESYAMMLAGLGVLGFVTRRRKQNAAA